MIQIVKMKFDIKEYLIQSIPLLGMLLLAALVYLSTLLTPDPVPDELRTFLEDRGYHAEGIEFTCVETETLSLYTVYQSSSPIFYRGSYVEFWIAYHPPTPALKIIGLVPNHIFGPYHERPHKMNVRQKMIHIR